MAAKISTSGAKEMRHAAGQITRRQLVTGAASLGTAVLLGRAAQRAQANAVSETERRSAANQAGTTDITGQWAFNGNGSTGMLYIYSVDDQGNLTVSVVFDGLTRQDAWLGSWNDAAKGITLTRYLPNYTTQIHTGYLGDNDPSHLMLGGSFTESDILANAPRNTLGWFALRQSGFRRPF